MFWIPSQEQRSRVLASTGCPRLLEQEAIRPVLKIAGPVALPGKHPAEQDSNMSIAVLRIAAFSEGKNGGNPAGVWIGGSLPAASEMQAIAAEVGFSETV